MPLSEMLLPEFDQEMANTRKTLERVPEDNLDYKPHEKSMSMAHLAGHVATLPGWAVHTLSHNEYDIPLDYKPWLPTSRAELLAKFDEAVAEARKLIFGMTDSGFQETWTLKYGGNTLFSMPRFQVFRSTCMNHVIHHRAQLGVYLRLNNVEVPGMYGPSADEQQFWNPKAQSQASAS